MPTTPPSPPTTLAPAPDPASAADRAAAFDRGAGAYAQVRPSYPDAAVDWLLPDGAHRVLDLAAGTGKLTTALAARGLDVVAVDPSPAMLAELTGALPDVETHVGTAEAVPLPDASVDAVVVGQAWHWFDPPRAAAEIARVLRPGGQVGVAWNDRDDTVDWVDALGRILHAGDRLAPDHARGATAPTLGEAFTAVEDATFTWTDRVRTDSLRPLAATRSYVLTLADDARERLLREVDRLVATHPALAGRREVGLPYRTHAFRARVRG